VEEATIEKKHDIPVIYKGIHIIKKYTRSGLHVRYDGQTIRHGIVICFLALFVIATNISDARALENVDFIDATPQVAQKIVDSVAPFTPVLNENSTQLAMSLDGSSNTYLEKPDVADTIKNPTSYTVQKGDTLSTIARNYSITVATLLDANGLKATETNSLKSGQTLVIPPYNTSTSLAWIDEVNKQKAIDDQKARETQEKKKKQLALSSGRNLPYRESSTTRQKAADDYSGYDGGGYGFSVPINHNGISRGVGRGHTGIDYRADVGTPVSAARDGKVVEITGGWAGGWGSSVVVDHGGGLKTRYAHLSRPDVSIGDTVSQGSIVGYSGNTGFSTGPHLHFEARVNGSVVQPF